MRKLRSNLRDAARTLFHITQRSSTPLYYIHTMSQDASRVCVRETLKRGVILTLYSWNAPRNENKLRPRTRLCDMEPDWSDQESCISRGWAQFSHRIRGAIRALIVEPSNNGRSMVDSSQWSAFWFRAFDYGSYQPQHVLSCGTG